MPDIQAGCGICADFWEHNRRNHDEINELKADLEALKQAARRALFATTDPEQPGETQRLADVAQILDAALVVLRERQAELSLLREVAKRAERFHEVIAAEDNFWPGEPEGRELGASLQAYKEFMESKNGEQNPG